MSLKQIQDKINKRFKNRQKRKLYNICLSPAKAKEDVDFVSYIFDGKQRTIKNRPPSQKHFKQARNYV